MAVTDLTGTTWIFNENPTLPASTTGWDVEYSNVYGGTWNAFVLDYNEIRLIDSNAEYSTELYTTSEGWITHEVYDEAEVRVITFTGGDDITSSTLISWLQANAVLQTNDYFTCTDELTSIADAIRAKGGTSASLVYPDGFVTAINNLPTKVLGLGVIGQDTPFDIQVTAQDYSDGNWDGFSSVNVNIETPIYDGSCDIINPPQPFNFTIANVTYSADEGMTWAEWVASNYNTGNFELINFGTNYKIVSNNGGMTAVCHRVSYPVYGTEIVGTGVGGQGEQTAYVLALY